MRTPRTRRAARFPANLIDDFPRTRGASSYDRAGGNADALSGIQPGTLPSSPISKGPGMITHILVTISAE